VGQGLTLGPLIERLGVTDDGSEEREEVTARVRLAEAALARIEELTEADWARPDTLERVRGQYDYRRRRFAAREDGDGDSYEERTGAYQRVMHELFDAQREELIGMRNRGDISDEVRRRVERELDLEESRLMS
jgi:monovalent cation/hydrogen antiporter